MTRDPAISVIVVTYNGRQHLKTCLDAVLAQDGLAFEVIVVDNASSDGSAEFVRSAYPDVRLVMSDRNRGFAGGNNLGAAHARSSLLAFLNNDTAAERDWLDAMRRGLQSDAGVAMVASRIVYMHDPAILDSAGDSVTRAGGAFKRGHGAAASRYLERRDVFGACGAACLIRKAVFDQVGGFDEDFFLSHEDVDLSYRVRLRGYRCVYVPDAVVRHVGSASLGRTSHTSVFYGQRNLEWVYIKNTPGPILLLSLPLHLVYVAAAGVYFASVGHLRAFVAGKTSALGGLRHMWRKRRDLQRSRRASAGEIWSLLEPGWLAVKWREKRFDIELTSPR